MTARAWCPAKTWATIPDPERRGRARCGECGRTFPLVGRDHHRGWGRTRLPNHKAPA